MTVRFRPSWRYSRNEILLRTRLMARTPGVRGRLSYHVPARVWRTRRPRDLKGFPPMDLLGLDQPDHRLVQRVVEQSPALPIPYGDPYLCQGRPEGRGSGGRLHMWAWPDAETALGRWVTLWDAPSESLAMLRRRTGDTVPHGRHRGLHETVVR